MRSYFQLLRRNPNFSRLWLAQAISLLGDWFSTIVLSALVAKYSDGSGLAISGLLLARFLPPLLVSPLTGVLLDRFDRKRLLVFSDLARVFIVLMFLLVTSADRLWLVYVLTVMQFAISALFEPGRSALTPSVVEREDLVQANLLQSMTWSVMLAVGGVTGGIVAGLLGTAFALVIDSLTFLLSALLIWQVQPRQQVIVNERPSASVRDYIEGLRYAVNNPSIGATLLVKFGGSWGSIDALMIVYATYLFVVGEDGAGSMGILWAAFGVGAVLGPLVLNRFHDGSAYAMRRMIVVGFVLITLGWIVFGVAPVLAIAAFALVIKAMGSSIYWTFSSVLLQKQVPDQYLGRMFSLDMSGFQLSTVISTVLTGWALESFGNDSVRIVVGVTAAASIVPLVFWALSLPWIQRQEKIALAVSE